MTRLDVVIPVYNEGPGILDVLESLRRELRTPFRVIVCYDFDGDDTLAALDSYSAPFEVVRIKSHGTGPHAAVVSGFQASTAPAVVVLPADDTYNARRLDPMVARMESGCDIVAASRFVRGGRMIGCPLLKTLLVRTSAFALHRFARVPTHDASNGFRMFSRRVLDRIPLESSQGFVYSIELLVKCHRLGWPICEIPVEWFERSRGQSRFRVLTWLPAYLRWFAYAFATTFLRRGPRTVLLREGAN